MRRRNRGVEGGGRDHFEQRPPSCPIPPASTPQFHSRGSSKHHCHPSIRSEANTLVNRQIYIYAYTWRHTHPDTQSVSVPIQSHVYVPHALLSLVSLGASSRLLLSRVSQVGKKKSTNPHPFCLNRLREGNPSAIAFPSFLPSFCSAAQLSPLFPPFKRTD